MRFPVDLPRRLWSLHVGLQDLQEATATVETEWSRSEKYSLRTRYLRGLGQTGDGGEAGVAEDEAGVAVPEMGARKSCYYEVRGGTARGLKCQRIYTHVNHM